MVKLDSEAADIHLKNNFLDILFSKTNDSKYVELQEDSKDLIRPNYKIKFYLVVLKISVSPKSGEKDKTFSHF